MQLNKNLYEIWLSLNKYNNIRSYNNTQRKFNEAKLEK